MELKPLFAAVGREGHAALSTWSINRLYFQVQKQNSLNMINEEEKTKKEPMKIYSTAQERNAHSEGEQGECYRDFLWYSRGKF